MSKDRRERMREIIDKYILVQDVGYRKHELEDCLTALEALMGEDFPKCSTTCEVVKELGVGECENVCPKKFKSQALMGEEKVYTPCCTDTIGMPIHCNHKKPKPQAVSVGTIAKIIDRTANQGIDAERDGLNIDDIARAIHSRIYGDKK